MRVQLLIGTLNFVLFYRRQNITIDTLRVLNIFDYYREKPSIARCKLTHFNYNYIENDHFSYSKSSHNLNIVREEGRYFFYISNPKRKFFSKVYQIHTEKESYKC